MSRSGEPLSPAKVAERLRERGAEAPSALAALDLASPDWGKDPELEAGVAAWLGNTGGPEAGARLHELEARTRDKLVKKEIKRALYRLQQRGLWSPPAPAPPPSARELLGPTESEPEAWLTPIDPTGIRLLWMARRSGDGVVSLSAVISDIQGLVEFHAGETNRRALKEAHRDLARKTGLALVEAPWPHVDALLAEAYERAPDRARFEDVGRARRAIAPNPPAGPVPPPVDALLDRGAVERDPDALARSADALREGEGAAWLLPLDWLEPTLAAVEEARSALVIVSPAQQEERVREAIERGIEEIFAPPERRRLFERRLEETAYLLAKRGREPIARALLAASLASAAGRKVAEIPALAELARVSLAFALEARRKKAEEESRSSLIVTPQQALAEQQRRSHRR